MIEPPMYWRNTAAVHSVTTLRKFCLGGCGAIHESQGPLVALLELTAELLHRALSGPARPPFAHFFGWKMDRSFDTVPGLFLDG